MTTTMPFTPRAQPGESPLGLLRRATIGNGLHSTLRLAYAFNQNIDHSGVALGTLVRNADGFRKTCASAGISAADIEQVSYRRIGQGCKDDLIWQGLQVPISALSFTRSKTCVACYHENGIALAEWDHVGAVACSKHHTLLMDECPVCHTPWTYDSDPFSCGCPRNKVLAAQTPVPESCATLLHSLVAGTDSAGLRLLEKLCDVLTWWTLLGLNLTRLAWATALESMFNGFWPTNTSMKAAPNHDLHPRLALAPLLATPPGPARALAEALLARPGPLLLADHLPDWTMSTTLAMAALGVNRVPFDKLVRDGHITGANPQSISAASVNHLLWRFCGHRWEQGTLVPLADLRSGKHRLSLSGLLAHIESKGVLSFDCRIEEGLGSLRVAADILPQSPSASDLLDLTAAAARLHTNKESVRNAAGLGLLPGTRRLVAGRSQWTFTEEALETFDADYVFASTLARAHGWSVTTFSNRLRSAGLKPVSGPGIDSAPTYLFRRSDVDALELRVLALAEYASPAGRKKRDRAPEISPLTVAGAARRLAISDADVRKLARSGWLPSSRDWQRRLTFRPEDIHAIQVRLKADFVDLADVAATTWQSPNEFRRVWVGTGFVEIRRFGKRELVRRDDLPRIHAVWGRLGSSTDIARALGRSRSLCSNLEKSGVLRPTRVIGMGAKKIKLYARRHAALKRYDLTEVNKHE